MQNPISRLSLPKFAKITHQEASYIRVQVPRFHQTGNRDIVVRLSKRAPQAYLSAEMSQDWVALGLTLTNSDSTEKDLQHGWNGCMGPVCKSDETIWSAKLVKAQALRDICYDFQDAKAGVKLRLTSEDFEELDNGPFEKAFTKFVAFKEAKSM